MKIINFITILFVVCIGIISCEEEKFTDPTPKGRMEEISFAKDTFIIAEGADKAKISLIAAKYVNYATKIKVKITPASSIDSTMAIEKKHFFMDLKEVTIPLGQSQTDLDLRVIDDTLINPNRMFAIDIESITGGGYPAKTKQHCIVILRNDDFVPEATIVFENLKASVKENTNKLIVPFYVTKDVAKDITITFASKIDRDYTAKEGFQFNIPNKTVVLPEGTKHGQIQLEIIDDNVAAGNTTLGLVIRNVDGALISRDSICVIEILDDDLNRIVKFESDTLSVDEDISSTELSLIFENGADPTRMISGKVVIEEYIGCTANDFIIENPEFSTAGNETLKLKVNVTDNDVFGERSVKLAFRDLKGANALYKSILVNLKDDERILSFEAPNFSIKEDTTAVNIPIKLIGGIAREDVEVSIEIDQANTTALSEQYTFRSTTKIYKGTDHATFTFTPHKHNSKEDKIVVFTLKTTTPKVFITEESKQTNITIRNTDASLGFGRIEAPVLRGRQIVIPVISSGFADGILANITIKSGATAIEGTHYTMSTKQIVFAPNELRKEIVIDAKNFKDKGDFGFTLEIKEATIGGVTGSEILNPETFECAVRLVVPEVIYFSTEEEKNDGPAVASNLVDGNEATFWHTKWSGGAGQNPPNPHTLIVDMHSTVNIEELELLRRNGDTQSVILEVSKNNQDWVSWGTISPFPADHRGKVKLAKPYSGRYVKLTVTGKANGVASLKELYVRGKNQ